MSQVPATADRVGSALNMALGELCADWPGLILLGEDIADPYGGAFGITRGLSTRYPERVFSTPISEGAIVGVAAGLALAGSQVIVEIMFADFVSLCFDQILNFVSKSVSMYGRRLDMPVIVRCPAGGNRGYGPTHSQSPQKHFLGIANLALYELSPLHPVLPVLECSLSSGDPALFFEDKVLYTQPRFGSDRADDIFSSDPVDGAAGWMRVSADDSPADWVIIAPGGLVRRALGAMRDALIGLEIACRLLCPARLFPLDLDPVLPELVRARRILVVDDGVAGGSWAEEVAGRVNALLWGRVPHPVRVLQPPCVVIPAAPHLERQTLVQQSAISSVLTGREHDG